MLNRGTQALLCILRSMSVARFTGVVPLLYCADAFKVQRNCGLEFGPSLC